MAHWTVPVALVRASLVCREDFFFSVLSVAMKRLNTEGIETSALQSVSRRMPCSVTQDRNLLLVGQTFLKARVLNFESGIFDCASAALRSLC